MAITRGQKSAVMTASGDVLAFPVNCAGIALVGAGLNPGERLRVVDRDNKVIADHYINEPQESQELIVNPQWFNGIKLDTVPTSGTWTVVVKFK